MRLFFFFCFLLTGLTGLTYQVLWERLLVLSFGYTIYSVTIVVTTFMGGLALGSFLGGLFALAYSVAERSKPAAEVPVEARDQAPDEPESGSILKEPIFWTFGISGFVALACEVVWFRLLTPYLENSTYAFSLVLSVFLLGIAAGGWAGRPLAEGLDVAGTPVVTDDRPHLEFPLFTF